MRRFWIILFVILATAGIGWALSWSIGPVIGPTHGVNIGPSQGGAPEDGPVGWF